MTPFLQEGENKSIHRQSNRQKTSFIHRSKSINDVIKTVDKVASSHSPIFIIGEKGTGKNFLAQYIHEKSSVRLGPLATLHCRSLSEAVLHTELFGFKGDDAILSSEGALRKADGGTLVLDDVSVLPLSVQEKLCHFIKTGDVVSSGSSYAVSVNTRLILIMNQEDESNHQLMKAFLDYLNPVQLRLPALSQRKEDISDLVHYFADKVAHSNMNGAKKIKIPNAIINILKLYRWPGNIRELKNVIEQLSLVCKSHTASVHDLPQHILDVSDQTLDFSYDPEMPLSEVNRLYILSALKHFTSKKRAAKALGITVKTLYNRLHEYGVFDRYAIHSRD